MKIRVWLIAAAFALLIGLLAGCGGGSSKSSVTSRALVPVTIKMQFPASGRGIGRALSLSAQSISLEVFNGTVRVAQVGLTAATPTATLPLPPGPLTFYANAYPDATAPDYRTDPTTGLPVTPPNDPSMARGVTTQEVPIANGQPLVFSGNSNVASLVPNLQSTTQPYATVALDTGTLPLANLMTAKDAQGSILLLPDGDLTWQVDTADPLAAQKASVSGLTLSLLGTGQVNLIAADTKVNTGAGQKQITGVFPLLITPAAAATTLTANVTQIPLYARSVTVTVSQDLFITQPANTAPPANGANQPPPPVISPPVTAPSFTFPASPAPQTTYNATVTINNFTQSGRKLDLTAQAWSNTDGTGALLATYTLSGQASSGSPFAMPLASKVAGFILTPVSAFVGSNAAQPRIYQLISGSTTTPTTVTLQATLVVKDSNGASVDTGQAVHDPTTLQWISDDTHVAVSQSGVVTSTAVVPAAAATITAYDKAAPVPPATGSIKGTIPITILLNSGTADAIIQ